MFGTVPFVSFALGRAVPIILGAGAVGWLESLKGLRDYQSAFEIAGGLILIAAGLYMLNAYCMVIPELAV